MPKRELLLFRRVLAFPKASRMGLASRIRVWMLASVEEPQVSQR